MDANSLKNYFDVLEEAGKRGDFMDRHANPQPYQPQTVQLRPDSEMPEPFHGKPIELDEFGLAPQMLAFEGGLEFEDNYVPPLEFEDGPETPVYDVEPQAQPQPQGSFSMGGVDYKIINGKWTALKPDGTPMSPGEMYQHTSQMHKNPGHVTGKPLLPSKLFQKPTIAQR